MPVGTGPTHSAAGSRGYVRIGSAGVLSRYSTGSIALGGSPLSHNNQRTWWLLEDFDKSSKPDEDKYYILPCDNATFTLGDDLYKSAEDSVPGAMRMRASRCGGYAFKISFPLVITSDPEIVNAYDTLRSFVQKANSMVVLNTSLQTRDYSCVLDNFSISVDGYNGASPVNCQLSTKGLTESSDINDNLLSRSFIADNTRRDKETRSMSGDLKIGVFQRQYPPPTSAGDASTYGGRLVNIKDCAVSLNNATFQQIVSMDLSIQHELKLASTAKKESFNTSSIRSADRMFLLERTVKGSFKALSSYTSTVDLSSLDISNTNAAVSNLAKRNSGYKQWASPLYMRFGPDMIFDMPAVYWQPKVEEISTGSPLITINFIARSNIYGVNEFRHGL